MNSDITNLYLTRVLLNEHDETDMSVPSERKEIDIGKEILRLITDCETTDASYSQTLKSIKSQAQALVDMHTAK